MSPEYFREGPFKFQFSSGDRGEPVHVHVYRDRKMAKIWLDPIEMAYSGGFTGKEQRQILAMVEKNYEFMIRRWNAYFS